MGVLGGLGVSEIVLIIVILALLFGGGKMITEIFKSIGKGKQVMKEQEMLAKKKREYKEKIFDKADKLDINILKFDDLNRLQEKVREQETLLRKKAEQLDLDLSKDLEYLVEEVKEAGEPLKVEE